MACHGGATHVALAHVPQALFVGFGSTELHTLMTNCTLNPGTTHTGDPHRCLHAWHTAPLLDATLISIILTGTDAAMLKEGTRAIIAAFKDAAAGKISKEEFLHAVLRLRVMSKVTMSAGLRSLASVFVCWELVQSVHLHHRIDEGDNGSTATAREAKQH
jgi:hypothetical protein